MEVSQIARTLARSLGLNEDLSETLSLSHDLGHTPFGHAGEEILGKCMNRYGGFNHNIQTIRVVTTLENKYYKFKGLNLTIETLDGLIKHNGPVKNISSYNTMLTKNLFLQKINFSAFPSLEAQVASISDDIAYMNHDLDDGFRAGLFNPKDLKRLNFYKEIIKEYGLESNNDRFKKELVRNLINKMVVDLIKQTEKNLNKIKPKNVNDIRNAGFNIASFSNKMKKNILELRLFLNKRMYNHKTVSNKTKKYKKIIENLYHLYSKKSLDIPSNWVEETYNGIEVDDKQMIIDYVSGMTDRYILKICKKI